MPEELLERFPGRVDVQVRACTDGIRLAIAAEIGPCPIPSEVAGVQLVLNDHPEMADATGDAVAVDVFDPTGEEQAHAPVPMSFVAALAPRESPVVAADAADSAAVAEHWP